MVWPNAAGESVTDIPALFIASFLSAAVPVPPEMMAPAWPMRRPGGAVAPAMKPTIGFFTLLRFKKSGASSFGRAADFADHDDRLGGGIAQEHLQAIDEIGTVDRIAADADAGRLAEPRRRGLRHRFVGEGAGAGGDADAPRLGGVPRPDA